MPETTWPKRRSFLERVRDPDARRALIIRLAVTVAAVVAVFILGWALAGSRFDARFRVVYSLDRRQNDLEVIKVINSASKYAYFAVYYFTQNDIADALIRAEKRGIAVRGIIDRDASTDVGKAVFDRLTAAGIPVEVQKHEDGIMHIKALVTDKAYASGSYNWTEAATDANDEVLEIGTDPGVHDQYLSIIKKVLQAND